MGIGEVDFAAKVAAEHLELGKVVVLVAEQQEVEVADMQVVVVSAAAAVGNLVQQCLRIHAVAGSDLAWGKVVVVL